MMSYLLMVAILLTTSCSMLSSLNPISALTSTPSIGVEATLGDKNQTASVETGHKQQATVINNTKELDPFLLIVALLGWIAPSPGQIWRWLTGIFRKK